MLKAINQIFERASVPPEGYERDGLIYCQNCDTPRQTIVTNPITGKTSKVGCVCKCRKEELDAEFERLRRKERERRIAVNRSGAFDEADFKDRTFDNDDGMNPETLAKAKKYAENFPRFLERGHGLLLFGNVGTGKTYYAACIANDLIQKGYRVKMTNFPKLVARIQADKFSSDVVSSLGAYDLLIIDDLGVERSTPYMQEQVYAIIDERYRSKKPIIVTSNISAAELKNPNDINSQRIYGRIMEICLPIEFKGGDKRRLNACHREMLEVLNA
jgi:DNA replication protein DnaC